MTKILIIVESPAKIKTLKKFLGKNYFFASSVGHIRDLPEKEFGIDIEKNFEPKYTILPGKKDVIKNLKEATKKVDLVYLCPDPDREGEAIAWHIASILPKGTNIKRITFNSITKNVVLESLKHPREINLSLVNAQQARRLLDRIVGYTVSPILSKKLKRRTSGGRVQSVALKFVVDREQEIDEFEPIEYWNIKAIFKEKELSFESFLYSVDGKKVEKEKKENVFLIPDQATADSVVNRLKKSSFIVEKIEKKIKKRNPTPPFITSTMQQEASRHFRFSVSRTMSLAQTLYEGIDMGKEGIEGLITYMRTDSVKVTKEAIFQARDFIKKEYGEKYIPEKPIFYVSKKSAQEAHEAIRPTNISLHPKKVKKYLTEDQYKLYLLIWNRFIASQMKYATYESTVVDIKADNMLLKAIGSYIKFLGFLVLYEEKKDEEKEEEKEKLPPLKEKQRLVLEEIVPLQSFTKPPARFTEASLIKELEKSGIGRPSTYSSIMNKIQNREYTIKEKTSLRPTELGKVIAYMLEENFSPIMNIGFTAAMEDDLELVAANKREWKSLIKGFWEAFMPMVEKAKKEASAPRIETNIKCPKCGKKLLKIWSKNNYFYGCSDYPKCDYTATLESLEFKKEDYAEDFEWDQLCPKCGAKMVIRHGKYGVFLGCSNYPECQGIVTVPKRGEKVIPLKERLDCPALGCDGKIVMRRSRFGKIFYSCSNFPECNIIVNDLKALEPKYDAHHPKTPYAKKTKKNGYKISEELEAIIKEKEATRSDVLKKIWSYIKSKNLQNPKNKREIIPDEKLSKIIGKEPIDMMKLSKALSKHMKKIK
ncbi:MAG: DNA topoisomerase I [Chlamydiae bacterium SM23_39]|nr:MAG: DNA topoisomerase I [Chlamydiae bacterium SM23_39]